jgi:arginase
MTVKKIGVVCNVGAQIAGTQHAASVAATWIKEPDVMIVQNRKFGSHDQYIYMILDVITRLQEQVKQTIDNGDFPLVIGGDHSVAMGSLPYKEDTLVLWIDAHGDINTPEGSITKRIHGMPVAALMGHGDSRLLEVIAQPYLTPHQVMFVGVRDLDIKEAEFIEEQHISMVDHHQSIQDVINEVLARASEFKHIHISFDMDSLDPSVAPGVSTPVEDGITLAMAKALVEACFNTDKVRSMDIVEFNPLVETRLTVRALSNLVDIVNHYKQ